MQPFSFPKLPRIALVLALASTMCLSGCLVSLREALTMKTSGSSVTYALAYDQTYTAMRTALRWSSDGTLEDHRDQGYVLVNSVSRYRGGSPHYSIIWLDSLSGGEIMVTALTDAMLEGMSYNRNSQYELFYNMNYAVKTVKSGKPLPIMLAKEERFQESERVRR